MGGDEQNQKIDHKKHEKEEKFQGPPREIDAEHHFGGFEDEKFQGPPREIDAEHHFGGFEEEEFQGKNPTETIIPAKKFAKKFNQMKMNPRAWGQSGPKNTEDMEEKPSNSTILHAQFNPFEPKNAENMEEKDEQSGDKNAQDMEEKDEQKEPKI